MLRALDQNLLRAGLQDAFNAGFRAVAIAFLHGYRFPSTSRLPERSHARSALPGLAEPCGQPAGQVGLARRYHGGRCLSLARTAALRRAGAGRAGRGHGVALGADVHAVQRRPRRRRAVSKRDAILSGPAGGVVGMVRTAQQAGFDRIIGFDMGGTSDRRLSLRRRLRAVLRDRGCRGAPARADDEHPYRRGRRWIDPEIRRRPTAGRPGRTQAPTPAPPATAGVGR